MFHKNAEWSVAMSEMEDLLWCCKETHQNNYKVRLYTSLYILVQHHCNINLVIA